MIPDNIIHDIHELDLFSDITSMLVNIKDRFEASHYNQELHTENTMHVVNEYNNKLQSLISYISEAGISTISSILLNSSLNLIQSLSSLISIPSYVIQFNNIALNTDNSTHVCTIDESMWFSISCLSSSCMQLLIETVNNSKDLNADVNFKCQIAQQFYDCNLLRAIEGNISRNESNLRLVKQASTSLLCAIFKILTITSKQHKPCYNSPTLSIHRQYALNRSIIKLLKQNQFLDQFTVALYYSMNIADSDLLIVLVQCLIFMYECIYSLQVFELSTIYKDTGSPGRNLLVSSPREIRGKGLNISNSSSFLQLIIKLVGTDSTVPLKLLCMDFLQVYFSNYTEYCSLMDQEVKVSRNKVKNTITTPLSQLLNALVHILEHTDNIYILETDIKIIELLLKGWFTWQNRSYKSHTDTLELLTCHTKCNISFNLVHNLFRLNIDGLLLSCFYFENRVAAMSSKLLRILLQSQDSIVYYRKFICNRNHLTIILDSLIQISNDIGRSPVSNINGQNEKSLLRTIFQVELSISLGLLLASDPNVRNFIKNELTGDDNRALTIRSNILKLLKTASLNYFLNIPMIDSVTGIKLNHIDGVTWESIHRPIQTDIIDMFHAQENELENKSKSRVKDHHKLIPDEMLKPYITPGNDLAKIRFDFKSRSAKSKEPLCLDPDIRKEKECRLTYILLNYIIHYTFTLNLIHKDTSNVNRQTNSTKRVQISPSAKSNLNPDQKHLKSGATPRCTGSSHYLNKPNQCMKSRDKEGTTYIQFEDSLGLIKKYSQLFREISTSGTKCVKSQYKPTLNGKFAVRKGSSSNANSAGRNDKTWTIRTPRNEDLFYFSIPFIDLTSEKLESLKISAEEHLKYLKKCCLSVPKNQMERRWFLYDMIANVMPNVIQLIHKLINYLTIHGEEKIIFIVQMFRQYEIKNRISTMQSIPLDQDKLMELTSGNIVSILDQIEYYCLNIGTIELAMGSKQEIENIKAEIKALKYKRDEMKDQMSNSYSSSSSYTNSFMSHESFTKSLSDDL